MTVLSNCVDDDRILLSLLFEEVISCDLWETKHICEIGVLISCKFCDVSLRDVFKSHLLLHFFKLCRSFALFSQLNILTSQGLFVSTHPFLFLWCVIIFPFALNELQKLSHFEFLEHPTTFVFPNLDFLLHIDDLFVELCLLLEELDLCLVTVLEVRGIQVHARSDCHCISNYLEHSN
jgi:hypothetical protein